MNKRKPVVGEKLYVAKRTTRPRNNTEGYHTVTKVGYVYFELDIKSYRPCKFLIATWEQTAGTTHTRYSLYDSAEAYKHECADRELVTWWQNLRTHHYPNLAHAKIRQIREILEAPADA